MMNTLFTYLNKPIYKHILFWIAVFSFYLAFDRVYYDSTQKLIVNKLAYLLFQMGTAYGIIYGIYPIYKKSKNVLVFVVLTFLLFVLLNSIYVAWHAFMDVPQSNTCYARFKSRFGHLPFWEQVFSWRRDFFVLTWLFMQPTFFLIPFLWYEKNLKLSITNEQKKIAELSALKNQLNPHFLFNTLNNLYGLALEKSDKTPQVIERLSDILDYILYRCKGKYVSLEKEIELIENYLALEQLRYGKRVLVTFTKHIETPNKIAPLILLTFIENAFKHGVKQEIKQAKIHIDLQSINNKVVFTIENTKPESLLHSNQEKLGLINVKKQLHLLYAGNYDLQLSDTTNMYSVTLALNL
ncbi:sensor histidine kinase [Tenacibaculum sp. M341]|uniref:sensor histidine kinase n=1 Tax=Tenacibaculum sp. M341 TaxID=2530339 RepID=UPI0010496579|nr:histidine kinase [Tenacibaculum sp. M341]TCI90200.1 histidine kinase [Tenacibaculum sp. M341]